MAEEHRSGLQGLDHEAHAFVLRVWREEGARHARWRGQITHVVSGTRRPVLSLGAISLFVAGYLARMGVVLPLFWRIRRWLDHPRDGV